MRFLCSLSLVAALLASPSALAQVRSRVLVLVDTSGSMTDHLTDNNSTGGDGSFLYTDAVMTRSTAANQNFGLYPGYELTCPGSNYDGANSRMFAAKATLTEALNGWGETDWGLMRFTGTQCPILGTFSPSSTPCATDAQCAVGEYCVAGKCGLDNNLCASGSFYGNTTHSPCNNTVGLPLTFGGDCGALAAAGSPNCATPQTCSSDSDCTGATAGQCAPLPGSAASTCKCTSASMCPATYNCTGGRCLYAQACQDPGGTILVSPGPPGPMLPYVDGVEDDHPQVSGLPVNPELRASGSTPLAGATRSAIAWYDNIKFGNLDPQLQCRPYVLVLLTDGSDTCDTDPLSGPIAAAQGFVAATASGARTLNKIYVVAFGGPNSTLDAVAKAGGTGAARQVTSSADLSAAFADIAQSSALVERCNNADDDCDGICDEPYPDVAVTNPACSNPRPAKACNNGALPQTHCFASGVYVCSADQFSEVCGAPTCATTPSLCPTAETCNGVDDDCNGVIDDCTPGVPGSCCVSACPACNPTGVPGTELCNGCDDDCDGTIDDHLIDTGNACGESIGTCRTGVTRCVNAAGQDLADGGAPGPGDHLICSGVAPTAVQCNGCDNDCDGVLDAPNTVCYDGPAGTADAGICHAGIAHCTASVCPQTPSWGPCLGEAIPQPEICNGLDDDCNGLVDDVPDAGAACCPSNLCGVGQCTAGQMRCEGDRFICFGAVAPSLEICDGIDNDCNGMVDDVVGLGVPCLLGGATGAMACDLAQKSLVCVVPDAGSPTPDGGAPDAGNGSDAGGSFDAGAQDSGTGGDAGVHSDAGGPSGSDAGGSDAGTTGSGRGGCNCGSTSGSGLVPLALVLLLAAVRGKRHGKLIATALAALSLLAATACGRNPPTDAPPGALSAALDGGSSCTPGQLSVDPLNCGTCGLACSLPNADPACVAGQCAIGVCSAGHADLNRDAGDGCEYACPVFPPRIESCNGIDDDCDGVIDNGFDLTSDPLNCGNCGNRCAFPNAYAGCVNSTCVVLGCQAGFANLDGGPGCAYACPVYPPQPEECNGVDDDCDGIADDNLTPPPQTFCVQTAACRGAAPVCCGGAGWLCTYPSLPNVEVTNVTTCQGGVLGGNLAVTERLCDGIDGNCNGLVDESFPDLGRPCSAGRGQCQVSATIICSANKRASLCPAVANATAARDESCNGLDDDCDGQIDERTPVAGSTCYTDSAGNGAHPCVGWVDPMVKVGLAWVYEYEASRPDSTALSAGGSSSRTCSKPNVLPWAPVTWPQAAAACAAVRDSSGSPMRLCTAAEWQAACEGPQPVPQPPVWSFSTLRNNYLANICNDANHPGSPPAAWVTGNNSGQSPTEFCYTDWSSVDAPPNRLYDMSGNLAEWTSTSLTSGGVTYHALRGGDFNALSGGSSCEFSFDVAQPGFGSPSLGFRCCANSAP